MCDPNQSQAEQMSDLLLGQGFGFSKRVVDPLPLPVLAERLVAASGFASAQKAASKNSSPSAQPSVVKPMFAAPMAAAPMAAAPVQSAYSGMVIPLDRLGATNAVQSNSGGSGLFGGGNSSKVVG